MINQLENLLVELNQTMSLFGAQEGKTILLPKAKHEIIKVLNENITNKLEEINESYPTDIFPEDSKSIDARAAKFARLLVNRAIDEMKITDHRVLNGICVKCGYEE